MKLWYSRHFWSPDLVLCSPEHEVASGDHVLVHVFLFIEALCVEVFLVEPADHFDQRILANSHIHYRPRVQACNGRWRVLKSEDCIALRPHVRALRVSCSRINKMKICRISTSCSDMKRARVMHWSLSVQASRVHKSSNMRWKCDTVYTVEPSSSPPSKPEHEVDIGPHVLLICFVQSDPLARTWDAEGSSMRSQNSEHEVKLRYNRHFWSPDLVPCRPEHEVDSGAHVLVYMFFVRHGICFEVFLFWSADHIVSKILAKHDTRYRPRVQACKGRWRGLKSEDCISLWPHVRALRMSTSMIKQSKIRMQLWSRISNSSSVMEGARVMIWILWINMFVYMEHSIFVLLLWIWGQRVAQLPFSDFCSRRFHIWTWGRYSISYLHWHFQIVACRK